jgi:flavin reductase (DIM6/NTAB) family NADH-FMN oxidoreductase RutF
MLKRILNKLNGLRYPQEYLCLGKESLEQPLTAVITDGITAKDITTSHLFVGYKPVIIALPNLSAKKATLLFQTQQKETVATLMLNHIRDQQAGNNMISYYEGKWGKHRFLGSFRQYVISLNNRLYNKKPGNVFLNGNLLKQVQIAYSLPRIISLITVGKDGLYNLFPTDLHGPVNDDYYIISLRQQGKAARQVAETRRILISTMEPGTFKKVYSLGKNHMQELKSAENFPFSTEFSELAHLPVPAGAILYRELGLEDAYDHGIHRLFLFRILNRKELSREHPTLAHIHGVYASWRYNQGLPGNYLIR